MELNQQDINKKSGVIQMLLRSGFYIWALDFVHSKPPFFFTLSILPSLWWDIQSPAVPDNFRISFRRNKTSLVPAYIRP